MAGYSTTEIITLLARETGWTLEYIGVLPIATALILIEEIRYQRQVEQYQRMLPAALAITTWMNCMKGCSEYKPEDLIGWEPKHPSKEGFMTPIGNKPIKLADGKTYQLPPMNVNMMVEVEDKFDESFGKLFSAGKARPLRYMLWVMLKENHPELTEEEAGKLITYGVMADIKSALTAQLKVK